MNKIFVDADACPVKELIVEIAKEFQMTVVMVSDTSHVHSDDDAYYQVITVDKGSDSVDFAIINKASPDDIVVTQDYGLASIVLGKGCTVMNQNGKLYTNKNIDELLINRYMHRKIRMAGGKTPHQKKRTREQDTNFEEGFRRVVNLRTAKG